MNRHNPTKSRAFSFRPQRKEELQFKKEVEQLKASVSASKRVLSREKHPWTEQEARSVQKGETKKRTVKLQTTEQIEERTALPDVQVVLQGSSAVDVKARMPATDQHVFHDSKINLRDRALSDQPNRDELELQRGKGLAVVGSLNTTGPVPLTERKSVVKQKQPRKERLLDVETEGSISQDSVRQSRHSSAKSRRLCVTSAKSRDKSETPKQLHQMVHSVTNHSDLFDEQADMQPLADTSPSQPEDKTDIPITQIVIPSASTAETPVSDYQTVRPCSRESEYEAIMERLKQPVMTVDVVQVQGKMQLLNERPKTQHQRDDSELRIPQRPPRTDHGSIHDFCNHTKSELVSELQLSLEQSTVKPEAVVVESMSSTSHKVPSTVREASKEKEVSILPLESRQSIDGVTVTMEGEEIKKPLVTRNRVQYIEELLDSELQAVKEMSKGEGLQRGRTRKGEKEQKGKTAVDRKEWVEHLASLLGAMLSCGEDLTVAGSQQEVVSDMSRLHWHPAPPKLSIHPDVIQSHLFPAYQGAVLPTDIKPDLDEVESEDDLEDDVKAEEAAVAKEHEMDLERTLNRRHASFVDFTEMSRIRAGPMASLTLGSNLVLSGQEVSGISAMSHLVDNDSSMFTPARSTLDTQSHECSELVGVEAGSLGSERVYRHKQIVHEQRMMRSQRMSEIVAEHSEGSVLSVRMKRGREDELSGRQSQQSCTSSTPSLGLKTGTVYQYTADLGNEWMDVIAQNAIQQTQESSDQPLFPVEVPLRRAQSQPMLSRSAPLLMIPTDFETSMKEVEDQRRQINEAKKHDQKAAEQSSVWTVTSLDMSASEPTRTTPLSLPRKGMGMSTYTLSSLGTGSIGATGLRTRKKLSKGGHPPRISKATRERMKYCITALQQPSVRQDRRASCPSLKYPMKQKDFPKRRQIVIRPGSLVRTTSVILDAHCFDSWMASSSSSETNPYMWAQLKWDKWFDELYADENHGSRLRGVNSAGTSSFEELVNLKPQLDGKNREMMQSLQNETRRLTDLIDVSSESTAFHLCRRGALYRKMGRLIDAMDDLNRAIELEPEQLDAYWHRHLLYLLQKNDTAAMTDLSFIIKRNKHHSRAYRSLGQLFEKQGDLTMAVISYSQAISLQPDDGEAYYHRAQLFEKKKDLQLALEDYAMASKLMVDKTDPVFKHGKYNFDSGFWVAAVSDFTSMLEQDPANSVARTYRGRAYAKQGEYQKALFDLSAALHLDPSNSVAFYHRGCLLRKEDPHKALEDLSISLLIDNSVNNVMAYLHRGIVYTDMKKFDEAVPDFQTCIELDKSIPCAHTSLGLVRMQHLHQYQRAVQCFSHAIRADPTYVRGYVCRGDAYSKLEKLDDAIRDYSKAIHLRPDAPQYHLYRGRLLLKKGQLGLAAAHVRHAAELNKASLGSSATQQAVVQTFLHNYREAIDIIESAPGSTWDPSLFVLKGKTCLKAKQYDDAIENFTQALELVSSSVPLQQLKCSRAEVHFLIGQCYTELQLHDQALASYNAALRRDPTIAQAYYQRGLVKFKLKQPRSVNDFNRALAVDPSLFQAYLSRAAYYALKGRYTKAVLNCSEAVRLQPYSVRSYLYRGALKCLMGVYDFAVSDLSLAIRIDKQCMLAYYNRGCCYQKMKQTQKALMDYGTVLLMVNEPNLRVLLNRGLLYFEIKDFANALLDFLAAAEIVPNNPNLHHTIGLSYHRLHQLFESIASYTRVLELNPHCIEAYICRGNAYMDLMTHYGNTMAKRDYARAIQLQPTCLPARVNLGFTLQTMGHFQQAWVQFTGIYEINPLYTPSLEGRAIVSLQMGNTYAAFLDLQRAIQVEPTAELLTNRGVTNQFMKDVVNAMKDFKSAIQQDPGYSLAYFNAANLFFRQRNFHQALEYYYKALDLDPSDESALLNRGIVKVVLGDSSGGLTDFNEAASLSPFWAHIYYNRGNLYRSLGQFAEAESDYTRALELQPHDPVARNGKAYVIGRQGRRKEALEEYRTAAELEVT